MTKKSTLIAWVVVIIGVYPFSLSAEDTKNTSKPCFTNFRQVTGTGSDPASLLVDCPEDKSVIEGGFITWGQKLYSAKVHFFFLDDDDKPIKEISLPIQELPCSLGEIREFENECQPLVKLVKKKLGASAKKVFDSTAFVRMAIDGMVFYPETVIYRDSSKKKRYPPYLVPTHPKSKDEKAESRFHMPMKPPVRSIPAAK